MEKYSRQRQEILDFLIESYGHPTAEEIYAEVKKRGSTASKGTVYRNLNFLSEKGIIEKISMLNGADRYDYKKTPHNHVICSKCNKVFDFEYNFNLKKLTALEIKILNSFCEFIYKKLKPALKSTKEIKSIEKSEKNVNFIFNVMSDNSNVSVIMISIPLDRLQFVDLKKIKAFDDTDFINSQTTVKVRAGSSKITLEELKNLTCEDIILLENSKYDKLTLISGDLKKDFKVKVNPDMIISLNQEENEEINYEINNEVEMEKNLWDDIQVEINAEFDKVKMTIGELKQITQGQIVDLGSVFENEISLYVEEKKVAKGDLIIINDRYAVRLNEILSTPKPNPIPKPQPQRPQQPAQQRAPQQRPQPQAQAQRPQPQAQNQPQPQAQKAQTSKVVDEEFDYSDFEK